MKSNQLKELLKHIILEVNSQFQESHDYDNFDDPSNVANAIYSGLYKAPDLGDIDKTDGGQVYIVMLHSPSGPRHLIKRTPDGRWFYSDSTGYGRKWEPADAHIAAKKQDRAEYARTGKLANEMIANKDVAPDVYGAVNVEEGVFDGDVKKKAKELFGKVKKITKISHPESNSEYFKVSLSDPDSHHTIRKDKSGKLSLGKEEDGKLTFDQVDEETGTGAVAGFATPFAFKPTGGVSKRRRKKKKKHTNEKTLPDGTYKDDMEDGRRSNRVSGMTESDEEEEIGGPQTDNDGNPILYPHRSDHKVRSEILSHSPAELQKALSAALSQNINLVKIGEHSYSTGYIKYILEIMKDSHSSSDLKEISGTRYFAEIPVNSEFKIPRRHEVFKKIDNNTALLGKKRVKIKNETLVNIHSNINEMTSSGAGGQPGGMIQTPAWGTKNKLGSPKGIKGSEKLGYKVVRSITNEGK